MTAHAKNTFQDKGLVLVLQDLHAASPGQLRSKSSDEAARDYCWSALVLSSAFGFRVSPGHTYSLYLVDGQWQLSLISPEEWGARMPGAFVGECKLRHDMTWSVVVDESVAEDSPMHDALLQYLHGIHEQLPASGNWEALLRNGQRHLSYYQRVLAKGLASSSRQPPALRRQSGLPLYVPLSR